LANRNPRRLRVVAEVHADRDRTSAVVRARAGELIEQYTSARLHELVQRR
jgi:hypothetical protein